MLNSSYAFCCNNQKTQHRLVLPLQKSQNTRYSGKQGTEHRHEYFLEIPPALAMNLSTKYFYGFFFVVLLNFKSHVLLHFNGTISHSSRIILAVQFKRLTWLNLINFKITYSRTNTITNFARSNMALRNCHFQNIIGHTLQCTC